MVRNFKIIVKKRKARNKYLFTSAYQQTRIQKVRYGQRYGIVLTKDEFEQLFDAQLRRIQKREQKSGKL